MNVNSFEHAETDSKILDVVSLRVQIDANVKPDLELSPWVQYALLRLFRDHEVIHNYRLLTCLHTLVVQRNLLRMVNVYVIFVFGNVRHLSKVGEGVRCPSQIVINELGIGTESIIYYIFTLGLRPVTLELTVKSKWIDAYELSLLESCR